MVHAADSRRHLSGGVGHAACGDVAAMPGRRGRSLPSVTKVYLSLYVPLPEYELVASE